MAAVKYLDENGLSTVWGKVKGIVTPKADKVSGATAGHLAGLNSSGNLTDSGLPADNVAQKDGSYSGMTVGAAEDLVSAESVASEFTSRITGGSTAVGKGGTALLDKIKGRTLIWNQMENGTWASAFTMVKSGNTYTISGTTGDVLTMSYSKSFISGHKYLVKAHMKINRETSLSGYFYPGYFSSPTQWLGYALAGEALRSGFYFKNIITADSNKSQIFIGAYHQGTVSQFSASDTIVVSNPQVYDLTLMFGAGSEPATPEEFEALYPGPYYDYDPGTPKSNAATAIETVGWNQYDPATGKARVIGGKQYHAGGTYTSLSKDGATITPDASGLFTPDTSGEVTVAGGNSTDTIISLSDPSRNGTYEPYWRSELELGLGDIKVKSHNLWDEETETGTINHTTGAKETSAYAQIRAKNYIPCSPNATYYIKSPSGDSGYVYVHFYDSEYNYISGTERRNTTVIAPANASYILLSFNTHYGVTYNNDICINLSDPAFNGRYEPYGDGGVISITGGLKSAGAVYDEISGGKLVKRIESVDMGSMTWGSDTYREHSRFFSALADSKTDSSAYQLTNQINSYGYISTPKVVADNTVNLGLSKYNNNIYIRNDLYEGQNGSVFAAAMSGVLLYYELAQPIEYELAEAIPTAMRNDPYGTERRLPEDTAAIVTAPFRADITYSTNIKEAVQSMHQNFINVNSMQDFLAELGTLMGGTWTMRPADGKFTFTFTPNPSNE